MLHLAIFNERVCLHLLLSKQIEFMAVCTIKLLKQKESTTNKIKNTLWPTFSIEEELLFFFFFTGSPLLELRWENAQNHSNGHKWPLSSTLDTTDLNQQTNRETTRSVGDMLNHVEKRSPCQTRSKLNTNRYEWLKTNSSDPCEYTLCFYLHQSKLLSTIWTPQSYRSYCNAWNVNMSHFPRASGIPGSLVLLVWNTFFAPEQFRVGAVVGGDCFPQI